MYVVIPSLTDKSFLKWAYGVPKLPQGTKSPGNYWQFVRIYECFRYAFFKIFLYIPVHWHWLMN